MYSAISEISIQKCRSLLPEYINYWFVSSWYQWYLVKAQLIQTYRFSFLCSINMTCFVLVLIVIGLLLLLLRLVSQGASSSRLGRWRGVCGLGVWGRHLPTVSAWGTSDKPTGYCSHWCHYAGSCYRWNGCCECSKKLWRICGAWLIDYPLLKYVLLLRRLVQQHLDTTIMGFWPHLAIFKKISFFIQKKSSWLWGACTRGDVH